MNRMKKIAYFDCPAGIAGDMALAAMIDAGADIDVIRAAVDAVCGHPCGLEAFPARESVISGLRLRLDLPVAHSHRQLSDIMSMIELAVGGALSEHAAETAGRIFHRLAVAEGRVHGCAPADVHFHEVGALDSIVDVVGVAVALDNLGIDLVAASPLPVTRGMVETMHGPMAVPTPATVELLRGWEVYGVDARGEFVTPTGAALCSELAGRAGPMPRMVVERTGRGFGTKTWPDGRPNCVQVVIGELIGDQGRELDNDEDRNGVVEMSANIDDSTPDMIAGLCARLLDEGAIDAWNSPIMMKKGRPAWNVSALMRRGDIERLSRLFFIESTTIGVRFFSCDRIELERREGTVETTLGTVRTKTAVLDGSIMNVKAEYQDVKAIADRTGIPFKEVARMVDAVIEGKARRQGQDQGQGQDRV